MTANEPDSPCLGLPRALDFGFCAVGETAVRTLTAHNSAAEPVVFAFTHCPVKISPSCGSIEAGKSLAVRFEIAHSEAKVIVAKSLLSVAHQRPTVVKFSAIFKYPYLQLSGDKIDFGQLLVGERAVIQKELFNPSKVPAAFEVVKVRGRPGDEAIRCRQDAGTVPPGSSFLLEFEFVPAVAALASDCSFEVRTRGGVSHSLEAKGVARRVKARFSTPILNFGAVKTGQATVAEVTLVNEVAQPLRWELLEPDSHFSFSCPRGEVPPLSYQRLKVRFAPEIVGNYYKRAFCVLKDEGMVSLELVGSAFDILNRPLQIERLMAEGSGRPTAEARHFKITSNKADLFAKTLGTFTKLGLSRSRNENSMGTKQSLPKDAPPARSTRVNGRQSAQPEKRLGHESFQKAPGSKVSIGELMDRQFKLIKGRPVDNELSAFEAFFKGPFKSSEFYKLSLRTLDFGSTEFSSGGPAVRQLAIANLSSTDSVYAVAKVSSAAFQVSVGAMAVAPLETRELEVRFCPTGDEKFFVGRLSLSLCNESPHCPRLAATGQPKLPSLTALGPALRKEVFLAEESVLLTGDTFAGPRTPFFQSLLFDPPEEVLFVNCAVNQPSFRVVTLRNERNVSCHFRAKCTGGQFEVKPEAGVVAAASQTAVVVRFLPQEEGLFEGQLVFKLNKAIKKGLRLRADIKSSTIEFEDGPTVVFSPGFVGVTRTGELRLRNTGTAPVEVSLRAPEEFRKRVRFEPQAMRLAPNERRTVACAFTPSHIACAQVKVAVQVQGERRSTQHVLLATECKDGKVALSPQSVDFGVAMVNFVQSKTLTVRNESNAAFNVFVFKLLLQGGQSGASEVLSYLKLEMAEGVVEGNLAKTVALHFKPRERCEAKVRLLLVTRPSEAGEQPEDELEEIVGFVSSKISHHLELESQMRREAPGATAETTLDSERLRAILFRLQQKGGDQQSSVENQEAIMLRKVEVWEQRGFAVKSFCDVTLRANYPLLKIVDARCDDESKATIWERFQVSDMNRLFSSSLTASERGIGSQGLGSDRGGSSLTWDFGFVYNQDGDCKPRVVELYVQNAGGTNLEWSFKSADELPSDRKPTEAADSFSDREAGGRREGGEEGGQAFTVRPRFGSLKPLEKQRVEVCYYPRLDESEGGHGEERKTEEVHGTRGFFCVQNGKRAKVRLVGRTISSLQGKITTKRDTVDLPVVPVGLPMPVIVPFSLTNIGMTPLKYTLNWEQFRRDFGALAAEGVVAFENTVSNMMPGEKRYLRVLYWPKSPTEVDCRVVVRVSDYFKDIQTLQIAIRGTPSDNCDAEQLNAYFKVDDQLNAEAAVVAENEDLAYVSDDLIDFRAVPVNRVSERLAVLHNHSAARPLKFQFVDLQFSKSANQFRSGHFRAQTGPFGAQAERAGPGRPGPKGTVLHLRN